MKDEIDERGNFTFGASGCPAISAIAEKCLFGTPYILQTISCFSASLCRIVLSSRFNRSIFSVHKKELEYEVYQLYP